MDGVAAGRFSPVVDRVLGLEDLVEAHRVLEGSGALGKVVVVRGAR